VGGLTGRKQGTRDNGQWTMDNGQWTMDNGQWTMAFCFARPLCSMGFSRLLCFATWTDPVHRVCREDLQSDAWMVWHCLYSLSFSVLVSAIYNTIYSRMCEFHLPLEFPLPQRAHVIITIPTPQPPVLLTPYRAVSLPSTQPRL